MHFDVERLRTEQERDASKWLPHTIQAFGVKIKIKKFMAIITGDVITSKDLLETVKLMMTKLETLVALPRIYPIRIDKGRIREVKFTMKIYCKFLHLIHIREMNTISCYITIRYVTIHIYYVTYIKRNEYYFMLRYFTLHYNILRYVRLR